MTRSRARVPIPGMLCRCARLLVLVLLSISLWSQTTEPADSPGKTQSSPQGAKRTIPFSPETITTLTARTGNAATESSTSESVGVLPADIPGYCSGLAGTVQNPAALASLCEFALSIPKKLPDVICERETKRYWKTSGDETLYEKAAKANFDLVNHSDVITAKVTYREGREYYEDVRIDGQPADASAPWSSGAWSIGEFALNLNTIFMPPSKPEFRFIKQERLHSIPALLFSFHVSAENNEYYFLLSGDKAWYPEYRGKVWLDKASFQLLKLERETADMPEEPISRMKTVTEYSQIALGDGSSMVLPVHSDVVTCTPRRPFDNCARNIVRLSKWQKFRATTKMILKDGDR